jgi:hypothetical protein
MRTVVRAFRDRVVGVPHLHTRHRLHRSSSLSVNRTASRRVQSKLLVGKAKEQAEVREKEKLEADAYAEKRCAGLVTGSGHPCPSEHLTLHCPAVGVCLCAVQEARHRPS